MKHYIIVMILLALSCSKKPKNECYTHWISIFNQKLTLGCDKTIQYERPEPSACKLSGTYEKGANFAESNAIIWHIKETCTGVKTTEATVPVCYISENKEFTNFGCRELGINQSFYRVKE
jgi:Zn-dependent metalloprotease